jgi:hypothetical protein
VARKRRPNPFTIRLTPELRARGNTLAAEAELSLSSLFISALFGTPPPPQSRRPHPDRQLLAQLLAAFGRSNIANNINQLSKAAHEGSWPDSRLIAQACADIRMMRDLLFRALGRTPPGDPPPPAGP